MDLYETITVAKLYINGNKNNYLLIGWDTSSFQMFLYANDGSVWRGKFSNQRMLGFCKNLHISQDDYFYQIQQCLSQQHSDYIYELKSGFFYWKRQSNEGTIVEGFLPMDKVDTDIKTQPNLLDILIALNGSLKNKIQDLQTKFNKMKSDFVRSLRDTEEFLNLKVEMEKSLCVKFLNLVHMKKNNLEVVKKNKKVDNINAPTILKDTEKVKNSSSTIINLQSIDEDYSAEEGVKVSVITRTPGHLINNNNVGTK